MTIEIVREALKSGERNRNLKDILYNLTFCYNARIDENGLFDCELPEQMKGVAYALANWDQYENSNVLITHDLSSFHCQISNLITKLRTEE